MWLKGQLRKRPLPLWIVIVADVLLIGISLLVFAYFHHVRPREIEAVGLESSRESMNAAVTETAAVSQEMNTMQQNLQAAIGQMQAEPDPVGYFGTKFADKFTNGEVIQNGWNYQSANLNITTRVEQEYSSNIYVCDIYVKDIECFATAMAGDSYGRNFNEDLTAMAQRANSIVAINGDYYGMREDGAVIRNGTLYRDDDYTECEMCVLYWDGTMKAFPKGSFDAEAEIAAGAYQSWTFGPSLLDQNGEPLMDFAAYDSIDGPNPRTAIGYYEPGHYCFVVVDGRSAESQGVSMTVLARYMYLLGCKVAYNLDGGQTSQMLWGTETINAAFHGGRACSDIVYIRDNA